MSSDQRTSSSSLRQISSLTAFIGRSKAFLNEDQILVGEEARTYEANVSGFIGFVPAVIKPQSIEQVQSVLRLANELSVQVFPISRGKNWGLGSKLPNAEGVVVLDLSKMNRITKFDHDLGTITVEPGVTQIQVANFLIEKKSRFFVDVTGSGRETSLIGNLMERGVAYNSLRVESVGSMVVVLASGEILHTGFDHYENAKAAHVFKYGIGPALDGLFFQSGFGVVVGATFHLIPIPEDRESFTLSVSREVDVPMVMESLRGLLEQNVIRCITHVFNRERFTPAVAPHLQKEAMRLGLPSDRDFVLQLLKDEIKGSWWAVGSVYGTPSMVREALKRVKQDLSKYGPILSLNSSKESKILWVLKVLSRWTPFHWAKKKLAIFKATESLRALTRGRPTDSALASVLWPVDADLEQYDLAEPDFSPGGMLFSAPIIPLAGEDARSILEIISRVGKDFGFEPAVTFNTASAKFIEVVMSLDFPKDDPFWSQRAYSCIRAMNQAFVESGYIPYRLDIKNFDLVMGVDDYFWRFVADLKKLVDPNLILSPGRFDGIAAPHDDPSQMAPPASRVS